MTNGDHMHARGSVCIADSVRASVSDDGLVLLDVRGGLLLASNTIGARIWQWLESRVDSIEIADRLARLYDVPLDRARHDVAEFVTALERRGLVRVDTVR